MRFQSVGMKNHVFTGWGGAGGEASGFAALKAFHFFPVN
jgi:hypothetical protein